MHWSKSGRQHQLRGWPYDIRWSDFDGGLRAMLRQRSPTDALEAQEWLETTILVTVVDRS